MTPNKPWSSTTRMVSLGEFPLLFSSMKPYSMVNIRDILHAQKAKRSAAGLPKRDISPVSLWLLDHLLDKYFKEKSKDYILQEIEIRKRDI